MESVRIQNKLKLLFEKLIEPNYVMNNYYADGLINRLSNCSDPEMSEICSMPIISDLICNALQHIDDVHISVQVFLTRFFALVSCKELHFTKIFFSQGKRILKIYKEINAPATNPSLRVAAMEVAIGLVKHNSGISWLLETGVWKEILSLCNEKQTVFVVRQTYTFASTFLWRLNDLNDLANIKLVLGHVLKVFEQHDFLNVECLSSEQEEEYAKFLDPTLHILLAIVSTENRIDTRTLLLDTLTNELKINTHLYLIFDRMRREESCLLIAKLVFWFTFAKIFINKPTQPGVKYTIEDFVDVSVTYFNIIQFLVQRRNATLVLDFCTACNLICWTVCNDKVLLVCVTENGQIMPRNQMLFMCLVPLIVFVKMAKTDPASDEKLQDYIMRLLNSNCEHTTKAAYSLRSLLEELDTMQIIVHSVKKLSCLKNHLNNEQANIVFQALYYVLREYDPIDDYGVAKKEEGIVQYENNQSQVLVMTYVMETVLSLLKQHNINWHESLEVICLYTVVYNILQRPNLSTKFIVASLNVIAMAVKKFLPPNLSLLLEFQPGSSLNNIGKLVYMKMHDLSWEIRDSALELLLVCTELSFVKFPPFQKHILDNNLVNVAAAIAFNDYDSYVQVSALKCLGAASKIPALWDDLKTHYPSILDQLIGALRNSQEGIVRKEACNVLCEIYQNIKISAIFKQSLFEHMVSSAFADFHWEVQICALKFWKVVFHSLLTDQGMLDGTFPPVTFSRETRKIVTLNETEIQKRLLKILDELSSIGLLNVLIKLLHEDTEVEILDCVINLSKEIIDILSKYNVLEQLKTEPGEINLDEAIADLMCHTAEEKDDVMMAERSTEPVTSDNVIDDILNADDINLLAKMYENRMSLQNIQVEEPIQPIVKITKAAPPSVFIEYVNSKNFKSIIDEKKKWNDGIRSTSSLLDDVLGIYEDNAEVNALDCY